MEVGVGIRTKNVLPESVRGNTGLAFSATEWWSTSIANRCGKEGTFLAEETTELIAQLPGEIFGHKHPPRQFCILCRGEGGGGTTQTPAGGLIAWLNVRTPAAEKSYVRSDSGVVFLVEVSLILNLNSFRNKVKGITSSSLIYYFCLFKSST